MYFPFQLELLDFLMTGFWSRRDFRDRGLLSFSLVQVHLYSNVTVIFVLGEYFQVSYKGQSQFLILIFSGESPLEWQYFSFRYKSCKEISINTDHNILKKAVETDTEG